MFSDSVANAMLNDIPVTYGDMEVGLSTTTPVVSGGIITNITPPGNGIGYARPLLTPSDWNNAANRVKVTNKDIEFPNPTGDWGYITHVVVFDESTGTPLFYGQLTQAVNIVAGGKALRIPAGTISLALPL